LNNLYKNIDKFEQSVHDSRQDKKEAIRVKKTLYSLMLSDDVVQAVDAAAHRMGTSRSGLVNQILADYVSVPTPERRISDIFQAIEELMSPSRELVPFFAPGSPTMSLKSSLAYKYRPTVKYEVELHPAGDSLGELSVIFRTQSAALISDMTDFFRLWVRIENKHLAPLLGHALECALYDGKFVRPIVLLSSRECTAEEAAGAISGYVQLFDRLLKSFLGSELTAEEIEQSYCGALSGQPILI
jgi:hypothetical protein